MTKAYGYVRVSTEEQADSGLGLEAQRQRIQAYCTLKGIELTQVFEDAGVSGGKPLSSRPAGAKLLAATKKGKTIVIVAKLDRLFRSVADAANSINDFDKKGIELVAISEGFDMSSPYGRAMCQMASVFAELERNMIAERTRTALRVKIGKGERCGKVRYGYDLAADGKHLVENAAEQEGIALMRSLRDSGMTLEAVAAELTARNIATKEGGAWLPTTIWTILKRSAVAVAA